ncbi:MAG: hypothetical protein QGG20_03225 [Dehalococcoidia bacterium]|jgi:NhaP-type Na+/H+ or K+/H+ antiporter|nr:hypothetical protein [Dehalococcoidia bacterium]
MKMFRFPLGLVASFFAGQAYAHPYSSGDTVSAISSFLHTHPHSLAVGVALTLVVGLLLGAQSLRKLSNHTEHR